MTEYAIERAERLGIEQGMQQGIEQGACQERLAAVTRKLLQRGVDEKRSFVSLHSLVRRNLPTYKRELGN